MRYLRKQYYYTEVTFCIFALIAGVLLHFLYEWTGENYFAGLIAPINESTWEHLKLLFFPVLFFTIFEYTYTGHYFPPFLTARTVGCLSGTFFIVAFYYTYTGILGRHFLWVDILTFFAGVILCYWLTWHLAVTKKAGKWYTNLLCILLLLFLACLFFYFTSYPPRLPLFAE